ncbi:stage II sporulation protein M [Rhodohalobacter sp. 8-1]|uniref:stage II sporulation protein M n=1 Tax=Rhodohalobacter sp. 8-1 TaxID=3131972 RepID=UPI0030EE337A
MREVTFIKNNEERWKTFENLLHIDQVADPDQLAELYIELTDDLAYAQSHFPGSESERYLNRLTVKVHDEIHQTRKEEMGRFVTFWTRELPEIYAIRQKELLYSFVVMILALSIGYLSQSSDPDFVRSILGDQYVNMTINNIETGDPMAVYSSHRQMDMFLGITFNNVRVSFLIFVFGLLTAIGVGFILIQNGIMIGSFLQFFNQYDLMGESLRIVFIHGTLEVSAIVIAGAAGFVLGNSFLFPGTYTRSRSFLKGAKEGVKMIVGLIPVFITAGVLESFVTRYTGMPVALSLAIIGLSSFFILWYYVWLPQKIKRSQFNLEPPSEGTALVQSPLSNTTTNGSQL